MRSTCAILAFVLGTGALAQVASPGGEPLYRIGIQSDDPEGLSARLEALGYDLEHGHSHAALELFVSGAEHGALLRAGFRPVILEIAQPLATKFPDGVPSGYTSPAGITASLLQTQATFPTLARVFDIAAAYGTGSTHEGRPIYAVKISDNVTVDEDEPAILVASCHHSREIVTPEMALDIIARLTTQYGSNSTITNLVNNNEIWVIPVTNPDGLEYVWNTNNLWRKNRRPVAGGTGIDLNRNYDLGWNSTCSGSTSPGNDTYKGPSAFSEAETQAIRGLSDAKNFAKVIDFHSSGRQVLLSYLCSSIPTLIESHIDAEGLVLANATGWTTRDPSADGEHQEWQIKAHTSYAYLVEVHTSFQPAYTSALAEATLTWPLTQTFLTRSIPVVGHVTDAITGAPVVADIAVSGVNWTNGEHRQSHAAFGRYHLFLPAGSRQITFSAPGYVSQTVTVGVTATTTTSRDVQLQPVGGTFDMILTTSGGGVFDFTLGLTNIPAATGQGYCIFSLATSGPLNGGPLFGLYPDLFSIGSLTHPAAAGSLLHWLWPVTPPTFPASTFSLPPGGLSFLSGQSLDGVGVALTSGLVFVGVTPAHRITL